MNTGTQIGLAWRNLWRHGRRSAITIVSVAFGFAAVALFSGYTSAVYIALSSAAIHGELIGHLTVNLNGWETDGKLNPAKYLLTSDQIGRIRGLVNQLMPGASVIPKLSATGLLSNGHNSTIFVASGVAPSELDLLRGPYRNAPGALHENMPTGVTVGQGLADVLGLKIGDAASILATTIHGQTNAADVDIADMVNTGNAATNDKWILMPIRLVQELLDAPDRAESLTVLLPPGITGDEAPTEAQSNGWRDQLMAKTKAAGLDLQVRTWQDMSVFFRQVKNMYDIIFALIFVVVMVIVVLSIANAMSIAVVERTREIGTLRALGLRRAGLVSLFVTEGLLLVLIGTVVGLALAGVIRWGVNAADVRYVPPGNTTAVPIYIGFDCVSTVVAAGFLMLLGIVAALVPAYHAARRPIVDALGHV